MAGKEVKLFGMWASPIALRVRLALQLKEIEYDYIEEDLENKSPLLLQYNPVHKKIPVLVHGGQPIAESFIIIEYIEETWKHKNAILPEDPYERAMARFWARFFEDKCSPAVFNAFFKLGEEQDKAVKEAIENMKILEEGFLKGKRFFGGENLGFVDIIAAWFPYWIRLIEEIIGLGFVQPQTLPLINAWFDDVLDLPVIKHILPPREKLRAHLQRFRQSLTEPSPAIA